MVNCGVQEGLKCCFYFSSLGFGKARRLRTLVFLGLPVPLLLFHTLPLPSLVRVPVSDELLKALLCSSPLCGGFPFKGGRAAALLSGALSLAAELAAAAPALASAGGCSVSSEGPLRPASPPCTVLLHLGSSNKKKASLHRQKTCPSPTRARPSFSSWAGRHVTKGFSLPALALSPAQSGKPHLEFFSGTANIFEKSVLGFPTYC